MNDLKKGIRPEIVGLLPASSPAEAFQNEVLRPILKMQHDLLIPIFAHYTKKKKVPLTKWALEKQKSWIEDSLKKDQRLRQLMLGLIIGQFTEEEWQGYQELESELARRIIQMMTKRLQDAIKQLTSFLA